MIHKACPIVLHPDGAPLRHLMFEHPTAGLQLVKGSIEPGEPPVRAAARELFEESGLETVAAVPIGHSDEIVSSERWHFSLCRVKPPVRDAWFHLCADDGGIRLRLSWFEFGTSLPDFSTPYVKAASWIERSLDGL